jgi:hypothetical protein
MAKAAHTGQAESLLKQQMTRRTRRLSGGSADRTSHRLAVIFISVLCLWSTGCLAADAESCSVEIFLAAADHKVSAQEGRLVDPKPLRVTIRNVGRETLTLVQPGDGSASGLRTPTVTWSVRSARGSEVSQHLGRPSDNQINPLESNEVFKLDPNKQRELLNWIPPIVVDGPASMWFYFTTKITLTLGGLANPWARMTPRRWLSSLRVHVAMWSAVR